MFERKVEIIENRALFPGTYLMTLREPDIANSSFPGQFVMIRPHGGLDPLLRRPFSICGLSGRGSFKILYQVIGHGTEILSEKTPGDRMQLLGPLGNGFPLKDAKEPFFLVGGGIGVAPIFSLAQAMVNDEKVFSLMVGFAGAHNTLSIETVLEQKIDTRIATEDGSLGHKGMVTELLEKGLSVSNTGKGRGAVFACGPPAMLRRVAEIADKAGVDCRVSLETAMACGLGACLGCTVHAAPDSLRPFHRVCLEGPVFSIKDLDWEKLVPP
jgi:dihydroorotate dehydrogenase electron transfer subunit